MGEVLVTLVSVRVIYKSQVDFFFLDGELVYKRHNGTPSEIKAKVVCGAQQADEIFKDFHASSHGAQMAKRRPEMPSAEDFIGLACQMILTHG